MSGLPNKYPTLQDEFRRWREGQVLKLTIFAVGSFALLFWGLWLFGLLVVDG